MVPVYGSPESISELCDRLIQSLSGITADFEVILVEDASPDESWGLILAQAERDDRIRAVRLARNFGQHAAISIGLRLTNGNWVVVMDCDLQDRPEEIPKLYSKAVQGYDQVVAVRTNRQDKLLKRCMSALFIRLMARLTDYKLEPGVGNFGIYHCRVIQAINSLPERGRTFGYLALWVGFRRTSLPVQHDARKYGTSSYTFRLLVAHALSSITYQSDKPLRIAMRFGLLTTACSMFALLAILGRATLGQTTPGWASISITMTLMTGLIIAFISITGLYIARILDEVKGRPVAVIWQQINVDQSVTGESNDEI